MTVQDKQQCKFIRDGSAYFISTIKTSISNNTTSLFVYFHGKPHVAVFPPWDGGIIWSKDKNNCLFLSSKKEDLDLQDRNSEMIMI